MTASPPDSSSFPVFRAREAWPAFLLGWGLGAALLFGVRFLAEALLAGPCQGRTLIALLVPLLLGPGGFALASLHRGSMRRAAIGLGLVVASLFPALYVGASDIGKLRTGGCAGGYLVLTEPGKKSVSRVEIRGGSSHTLEGRIGGYTTTSHPGFFKLEGRSSTPLVRVVLPRTQARAGETFPVQIVVKPGTPINLYTVNVLATQGEQAGAPAALEVDVRP